jgi:hypothetical protein
MPSVTPRTSVLPVTARLPRPSPLPPAKGYWVLLNDGEVFSYGDTTNFGSPASDSFNALNPATAIFASSDGAGYWVTSALGAVFNFGDSPSLGGMSLAHLNGSIIAGTGF